MKTFKACHYIDADLIEVLEVDINRVERLSDEIGRFVIEGVKAGRRVTVTQGTYDEYGNFITTK